MLLWVDIETGGLTTDMPILEVGWAITTNKLDRLTDTRSRLTRVDVPWAQQRANPFVLEMHSMNGLWNDLLLGKRHTLPEIEQEILTDLEVCGAGDIDRPVFLAGASVHFDASFLRPLMFTLDKRLHHRHYDVSTLKLFWGSVGVENPDKGQPIAHRAGPDVDQEIETARAYREFAGGWKQWLQ